MEVGKEAERRVGLSGPKERIPSLTGTAEYRIPDHITELTIEEVKDVLRLSRTNQIRDFLAYAQRTNRTLVLWIRRTTKVSGTLDEYINRRLIKISYIP